MAYGGSCYSGCIQPQEGCCSYAASPLEAAAESVSGFYSTSLSMLEESVASSASSGAGETQSQIPEAVLKSMAGYGIVDSGSYSGQGFARASQKYYFTPSAFLNNVPTEFISCKSDEQKNLVDSAAREAFEKTTGREIPADIAIRICSPDEMRLLHKNWHPGIRGFSLNRKGFGVSEIFVAEDELARLMLTIGHEIGHVASFPMKEQVDEEAKAFAFSLAWMDAVKKNNIGGIAEAIHPRPAENGLHNAAFSFVAGMAKNGRDAFEIYSEIAKGEISTRSTAVI